jgi:hypothetical protein
VACWLLLLTAAWLQNSRHWLLSLLLCWLGHSVDRWHLLRLLDGVWYSSSGLVLDLLGLLLPGVHWIGHRCDRLLGLVEVTWGQHCCGLLTGTGAGSTRGSGFDLNAPICSHYIACKVQQG